MTKGLYVLDKDHNPVLADSVQSAGEFFEYIDNRRVKSTTVGGGGACMYCKGEGKYYKKDETKPTLCDICHGSRIGKGYVVITVFLGWSRGVSKDGKPILFETMHITPGGKFMEFQERYCTWDEAVAGHEKSVKWFKDQE